MIGMRQIKNQDTARLAAGSCRSSPNGCDAGAAKYGQAGRTSEQALARAAEDLRQAKRMFIDQQQGASDDRKVSAYLAMKDAQLRVLELQAAEGSREVESSVAPSHGSKLRARLPKRGIQTEHQL